MADEFFKVSESRGAFVFKNESGVYLFEGNTKPIRNSQKAAVVGPNSWFQNVTVHIKISTHTSKMPLESVIRLCVNRFRGFQGKKLENMKYSHENNFI